MGNDLRGTVGVDFAIKTINNVRGNTVKMQIWDVAGKTFSSTVKSLFNECRLNTNLAAYELSTKMVRVGLSKT